MFEVVAEVERAVAAHKSSPPDRDAARPRPVADYFAHHHSHFMQCAISYDLCEVKNPWLDSILQFIPIWSRDLHEIRYVVLTSRIAKDFMVQTRGCYPGHGADTFYKNNYAKSFDLGLIGTIAGRNSVTVLRRLAPSEHERIIAF